MNYQLVNLLIDQATEKMTDISENRYNIPNFRRHHFAELIVRECADFLENNLDDHFAAEQLREHFGL